MNQKQNRTFGVLLGLLFSFAGLNADVVASRIFAQLPSIQSLQEATMLGKPGTSDDGPPSANLE